MQPPPRAPPPPPPPPQMTALLHLEDHQLTAMRTIFRMLRDMLRLCWEVCGAELATHDERLASCNPTTAFGQLENYGDDIINKGPGRAYISKLFQGYVEAAAEGDVSEGLARSIGGNVSLGPFFTFRLKLDGVFDLQGSQNREVFAGMFEATAGALHRKGCITLLENIVQWCALLNMHCIQVGDVVVVMHALTDGDAVQDVRRSRSLGAGYFSLHGNLDGHVRRAPLAHVGERWMRSCLASFGLPFASTELIYDTSSSPHTHYLKLVCSNHPCGRTDVTRR